MKTIHFRSTKELDKNIVKDSKNHKGNYGEAVRFKLAEYYGLKINFLE